MHFKSCDLEMNLKSVLLENNMTLPTLESRNCDIRIKKKKINIANNPLHFTKSFSYGFTAVSMCKILHDKYCTLSY